MYIVFIYTTTWAHLPRISQLSDKDQSWNNQSSDGFIRPIIQVK